MIQTAAAYLTMQSYLISHRPAIYRTGLTITLAVVESVVSMNAPADTTGVVQIATAHISPMSGVAVTQLILKMIGATVEPVATTPVNKNRPTPITPKGTIHWSTASRSNVTEPAKPPTAVPVTEHVFVVQTATIVALVRTSNPVIVWVDSRTVPVTKTAYCVLVAHVVNVRVFVAISLTNV